MTPRPANPPSTLDPIFRGTLTPDYRQQLEELFFFHPAQHLYRPAIRRTVETFGMPVIEETDNRLTLRLQGSLPTETLFMLEHCHPSPPLRGVLVYARTPLDTLAVVHLAATTDLAQPAPNWGALLLRQAFEIARRIRGVSFVALPYARGRLRIPAT